MAFQTNIIKLTMASMYLKTVVPISIIVGLLATYIKY